MWKMRWSEKWTAMLAAAAMGALAATCAMAAEPASEAPGQYDLTVIVVAPDVGPAQVALSYPRVVDHKVVQAGLEALAKATGAKLSGVRIEDTQQARGFPGKATAAQFTATGLVRPASGALPLGPIMRSLKDWQRMRVVFLMGEGFRFTGPTDASADGFVVKLVNRMKPYEYDVERKSVAAAAASKQADEEKKRSALLPAVLVGLPAGLIVGWLLGDVRTRGKREGRGKVGPKV
jgi:hypothetical protein